jgi:hypothetical protein
LELKTYFDFTPADLAANRDGALSEMQRYRLRVRLRRAMLIAGLVIFAGALIATGFIFAGGRDGNPILLIVGAGVTICCAAITAIYGRYALRLNADVQAGRALRFEGELARVVRPVTRRVLIYLVRVGEAEAVVSKEAFDAFVHGARYRLYRTAYTGTLLSVEALDQPQAEAQPAP